MEVHIGTSCFFFLHIISLYFSFCLSSLTASQRRWTILYGKLKWVPSMNRDRNSSSELELSFARIHRAGIGEMPLSCCNIGRYYRRCCRSQNGTHSDLNKYDLTEYVWDANEPIKNADHHTLISYGWKILCKNWRCLYTHFVSNSIISIWVQIAVKQWETFDLMTNLYIQFGLKRSANTEKTQVW
jgi:hypothetical protein